MYVHHEGNKNRANERTKDHIIKKVDVSFPSSAAPYAIAFGPFSSPEGRILGRILINWTLAFWGGMLFHRVIGTMALSTPAPLQAPGSACKSN